MVLWKKNSRFARQKQFILTLVLSEKKIMNETKNHTPPPSFKLNGRSLSVLNCALPFVDKMKLKIFTYTDINSITRVCHLKRIIEIYANGKLVVILLYSFPLLAYTILLWKHMVVIKFVTF